MREKAGEGKSNTGPSSRHGCDDEAEDRDGFQMKGLAAILAMMTLPSCASIANGTRQTVTLNSEPSSAEIEVFNLKGEEVYRGSTPATVSLNRGSSYFQREVYTLAFRSPDREPMYLEVQGSVNGWYFANFAVAPLIGMLIVDPVTGGMYELPGEVAADVAQHAVIKPADSLGIRILSVTDLPSVVRDRITPIQPATSVVPAVAK